MARICCVCLLSSCRQSFTLLALQLTVPRVSLRKLRIASRGTVGRAVPGAWLVRCLGIARSFCHCAVQFKIGAVKKSPRSTIRKRYFTQDAPVAQLDRASAF